MENPADPEQFQHGLRGTWPRFLSDHFGPIRTSKRDT
jgi:hypothetical protein